MSQYWHKKSLLITVGKTRYYQLDIPRNDGHVCIGRTPRPVDASDQAA